MTGRIWYKRKRLRGHPLADKSGAVRVNRAVLYEKIGPGSHPCHWCGATVTWMAAPSFAPGCLIADHIDWNTNNNDPSNLVPSCNPCNSTRSSVRGPIRKGRMFLIGNGEQVTRTEYYQLCIERALARRKAKASERRTKALV